MNKKSNHKTIRTYRSSATWKSFGGEKNSGKSITVQDESYTIKELLEKHTQGLMPNVGLIPEYDTEEPHIDDDMMFRKQNLDLTDIDMLKSEVQKTNKKLSAREAKAEAKKKEAKQAELEAKIRKSVADESKAKSDA